MEKMKAEICRLLKEDARMPMNQLAALVGATEDEVRAAVEQLEADKTIIKYTALINDDACADDLVEAVIEVKVSPMRERGFDEIAEYICQFPEVKNLFLMSGGYDLAIYVEGKSLREVARFVSEKLSGLQQVLSTATHFVLKRYKVEGVSLSQQTKERLIIQA